MKILTIDTSTHLGSVALVIGKELKAQFDLNLPLTHNQRLINSLKVLFDFAGVTLAEIDLFAVVKGPGSFTGVRIGVATAKGMAYALQKPLVGVNGLDVIAHNFPHTSHLICPVIDARKGQVFTAFYQAKNGKIKQISNYSSICPEDLLKGLRRKTIFAGTGVDVYKEIIKQKMKNRCLFPPPHLHRLHPQIIATLALKEFKKGGKTDPTSLVPFYIRPSDAELNRKR
ncbi:MAG: tRNA (adenosine(37)-N6)-threonylcarbamoyltransferase complex dimerization subunit type 1 TsaB [Candidatus Desulfofervidaceae bacterium]|nr:tRNA (adenosine(37)-N6)-threonylcarbamoyltransferase complex dimerization subunit type 1 TsaB [Candidatus Desulfofervidaceae bacterium]